MDDYKKALLFGLNRTAVHEFTAIVTACIRPAQVPDRQRSQHGGGKWAWSYGLADKLLVIDNAVRGSFF